VLARIAIFGETSSMSAAEIIEQIKALPPNERAEVAKFVAENDDSWIPESFKRGMADAEAGRFVDMETVLSGAKPPPRRTE
jgi:predicted transcriptional regulator